MKKERDHLYTLELFAMIMIFVLIGGVIIYFLVDSTQTMKAIKETCGENDYTSTYFYCEYKITHNKETLEHAIRIEKAEQLFEDKSFEDKE